MEGPVKDVRANCLCATLLRSNATVICHALLRALVKLRF